MLRALAAMAAVLLVAPPVASAAAPDRCKRTRGGALEAHIGRSSTAGYVTRLLVCDHRTGRRRVLRRAAYRIVPGGGRRGRVIGGAAVHRRTVAWAEARYAESEAVATIRVANARGRILRRFEVRRAPGDTLGPLGVAFLRDGRLAWIDPGGVTTADPGGVLHDAAVRGAPAVRVSEGGSPAGLAAEDGATLSWHGSFPADVRHRDVLPLPRRGGCPVRRRFRTLRATRDHLVSEAHYRTPEIKVTRVCVRATGEDPVVLQHGDRQTFGHGTSGAVTGIAGPWAITAVERFSRYDGCVQSTVTAVDLRTGAPGRRGSEASCRPTPKVGDPHAVTPAGVPAWVARNENADVLRTARPDGTLAVLDRGPKRSIARLRADGETFSWTSAGEARSAPAP